MHINDGIGMKLISLQRNHCQQLDEVESSEAFNEEKENITKQIEDIEDQIRNIEFSIQIINEEFLENDNEESNKVFGNMMVDEIKKHVTLTSDLQCKQNSKIKTMGKFEFQMEQSLSQLKVHNEHYFGEDTYVGNSMHKIYVDFC